ncbi:MAG TPA: HAMP domain-containing sensor histidine kinase [Candidatus Dormibacteraeota bacterium]|nr:HAMP domain-containing sensor histidine kinase [Candidatus Dormibacteraeota bacterium]
MSLRVRLLLAAAGIVGVSLLISGFLALVLVRSLEFDSAQLALDREALTVQPRLLRAACAFPPATVTAGCPGGRLADAVTYSDRVNGLVPGGGDRILLLTAANSVSFDSADQAVGLQVQLARVRRVGTGTASEGSLQIGGTTYLGSGSSLAARRNPLGANKFVLLRSTASLNGLALAQLLPIFVEAALLALAIALALALILSRAVGRPVSELAAAAEAIAGGDYSRRVAITGRDELGVLGTSFNRMAAAVENARTQQRDFLANVSHELKTPLTSLIGFSEALGDGSLHTDAERSRAAEIINEEAERVLRLSQELLDLARVEAGQLPMNPGQVDLRAVVEQEIEIMRPRAVKRNLAMVLDAADGLPPVRADQDRVRQVVANLLDNAVKYADPAAPVDVAIRNGAGRVEVKVGNRVTGSAPDPERIFERFYRGDPSRSSAAGGVGLGLSISRELATAMGGRLWAEVRDSEVELRLTLPL